MTINKQIKLEQGAEWLTGIKRVFSPNFDERPDGEDISLLVIHGISLPPGEFGGDYIDQLFMNTLDANEHPCFTEVASNKVSSHILINRAGEITQYVPFSKRAWHAGKSSFNGRQRCNDFSIGIELEGCDEQPYTDDQYKQLAILTRLFMSQWPGINKETITGHCHISPGRKTDPGPLFDWKKYFALLEHQD